MASDGKRKTFLDVVKEFSETSTVHGVPKIASSHQIAVKILWCILMIAGFCILTIQLIALFRTFTSHPVQTTVSLDFSTLRFPAISLCNMNPVKKSRIGMSEKLRDTVFPKRMPASSDTGNDVSNSEKHGDGSMSVRLKRNLNNSLNANNDSLPDEDSVLLDALSDDITEANATDRDTTTTPDVTETTGEEVDGTGITTEDDLNETTNEANATDVDTITIPDVAETTGEVDEIEITTEDDLNETTTNDPFEYSTYEPFEYNDDYYYVWDLLQTLDDGEIEFNISDFHIPIATEYEVTIAEHFEDPKDKWEELISKFKTAFRDIPVGKRKKMGHQLTDFVQKASFAKREQNITKYFKQFTTSKYGNCFTMSHPKYRAWGSGPDSGIKLTLYLEVDEYIENFSSGYGVRIVFHEPGTLPMPEEEGLTISPGYETSIGLRAINVTKLGDPYGDCSQNGNKEFVRKYNITYSKSACLAFCRAENVIKECGCLPYDAPDITYSKKQPICGQDIFDEFCVDLVDNKFEHGAIGCDCISPCSEFVYSKTISGRDWPHKNYLEKKLMQEICAKNVTSLKSACDQLKNDSLEFNYERYKNNFVRVLIYFEDLNYEKITEEPFYTPVRFVSDIGGAAGLFMGISLLSLFEVLQFLLEIVLFLYHKKRDPTPNETSDVEKKKDVC